MNKNQTIGSILLVVGAGLGILAYAHRPPEGLVDVLSRPSGSWYFQPTAYYGLLFVAALFVIAGFVRFAAKPKEAPKS